MAGSDTFRGCAFQTAYAVGLALDVLDGEADVLVVEGSEDVVDAALESADGSQLAVTQAKTRAEPYVWGPQEIADILARWLDIPPRAGAHFEFVTDGSLGRSVIDRLEPALRRAASASLTEQDRAYLESLGLDAGNPGLACALLRSRLPDGRTLLERATLRVVELRERVAPVPVEAARDLVWRLFGALTFVSGEDAAAVRRLTRAEIAALLGVPEDVASAGAGWSAQLEASYREELAAAPADPVWALLDLVSAERPPALTFVRARENDERRAPVPATTLLDGVDDALIQGPAGAGKTTTLAQLRDEALARGLLPIAARIATYLPGTIERLLRRALEAEVKRPLQPGVVRQLLSREDVVVILDGAGELAHEERHALLDDIARMRALAPAARFLVAARDPATVGDLARSAFVIQGLTSATRREIADGLVEGGASLVATLEGDLGDVIDNPLLFTMAVGLSANGVAATTRTDVFRGFFDGLQTRTGGRVLTAAARGAIAVACFDLRAGDRYTADRWWWLDALAAGRSALVERGILRGPGPSAEELLVELERLGLLHTLGDLSDLGLLHDLFCDWLAADAVHHGLRGIPDPVPASLEEALVFLAEQRALSDDELLAVTGTVVAAARVADALPAQALDVDVVRAFWERLRVQLGEQLATELDGRTLEVREGERSPVALLRSDSGSDRAAYATLLRDPVTALSAAVDVWLGVVRLALRGPVIERPRSPLADEDAITAALEAIALRKAETVEALIDALFPPLRSRVVAEVGPLGLHGWLLPAVEFETPFGTTESEHPFHYVPASEGVRVERVAAAEDVPSGATIVTTAEHYLRERPEQSARKSVGAALQTLIPRLDD